MSERAKKVWPMFFAGDEPPYLGAGTGKVYNGGIWQLYHNKLLNSSYIITRMSLPRGYTVYWFRGLIDPEYFLAAERLIDASVDFISAFENWTRAAEEAEQAGRVRYVQRRGKIVCLKKTGTKL